MSHRAHYLILVSTCLLNVVAMFFVAFGAAFGGPQRNLVWPAIVLMVGGVLVTAAISGGRATQVGQPSGRAFLAVALAGWLGPLIFVPIGYLALKTETQAGLKPVCALDAFLQPLVLLLLPWVVLFFLGLGRDT